MKIQLLICTLLLSACATSPNKSAPTSTSDTAAGTKDPKSTQLSAKPLTHEEAQSRFKQIAHVTYGLWFGLDRDNEDYEGRVSINFEVRAKAKDHGRDLFLDFYDGSLHSIIVNGVTLPNPAEHFDGNRIHFNLSDLQPGTNRIDIAFVHKYATNGHGLYKFKDPEDKSVYL